MLERQAMSRLKKAPAVLRTPAAAVPRTAAADGAAAAGDDSPIDDLSLPDSDAIVHRPDGWYWLGEDGRQEFGPYASSDEALADLHAAGEEAIEPAESLLEAEQEIGIADWLDPDTGEPAEGTNTRIEDH